MQWSYSGDVVLTTDASRALQLLDIRYNTRSDDHRGELYQHSVNRSSRRGSRWWTATMRWR